MGIEFIEDEADKARRGVREERREVIRKHKGRPTANEELIERELDPTMLRGPYDELAGKRFKWVNRVSRDGHRIQYHEGHGYQIVDPDKSSVKPVIGVKKDGAYVQGDLVLMETPLENYERRRHKANRKLDNMTGQYREVARENINKIARDEGRVPAHVDVAFDDSTEGETFTAPSPKKKTAG